MNCKYLCFKYLANFCKSSTLLIIDLENQINPSLALAAHISSYCLLILS